MAVASSVRESVIARVGASSGLSLQELFETTAGIATRDDIYALIAASEIYADLSTNRLLNRTGYSLFGSEAEARPDSDAASKPVHLDVRVEQQTAAEAMLERRMKASWLLQTSDSVT